MPARFGRCYLINPLCKARRRETRFSNDALKQFEMLFVFNRFKYFLLSRSPSGSPGLDEGELWQGDSTADAGWGVPSDAERALAALNLAAFEALSSGVEDGAAALSAAQRALALAEGAQLPHHNLESDIVSPAVNVIVANCGKI